VKTFNAKSQRSKGAKGKMGSKFLFFFASLPLGVFALNSGLQVFAATLLRAPPRSSWAITTSNQEIEDVKTFNAKAQRSKGAKGKMGSRILFFFASLHLGVFALSSGLRAFVAFFRWQSSVASVRLKDASGTRWEEMKCA
jgi:hypothetical protein